MQKVLTFSYFILLARNLVPEDLGKYYFAISFTTIFSIFIDLGLSNVLTREAAKKPEEAGKLLSSILTLKIPLFLLSLVATIATINFLNYPELTKNLVYISSVCMILDSFTLSFYALIRGFHKLSYESVGSVIFSLVAIIFGFIVIKFNYGLKWQMSALAFASIFNFSYSLYLIGSKFKIKLRQQIDKVIIKNIITIAIPFALYGVFQRLYTYLDAVFLSIFAGDRYVGFYQIAFKIIFALQFLPLAFMASIYPAFSLYWSKNREQLATTFERAMNYLIIISLPISFGITAISDKVISIFKPEYIEATFSLNIIMIALIFLFLNYPIGALLNACDRQRRNTINMGIALIISVAFNLILIPRFQAVGASITVVISNLIMFILGLIVVPQIIKFSPRKILVVLAKTLLATALMFALVIFLKPFINIFIIILLAGCVYLLMLLALGAIRKEDIISIFNSFISKSAVN